MARVILAYSGGADTALAIHWLRHERQHEVIAFCANVGQDVQLAPRGEVAIEMGAQAVHIEDLRDVFVRDFVLPALRANAHYAGYLLSRALARPLIAREMVRIARDEDCTVVAHGATGRGNDQLRFEATFASLAPDLRVMAPLRDWDLVSRADRERYIAKHGLSLQLGPHSGTRSVDQNLWGTTIAGSAIDDLWAGPPDEDWVVTVDAADAPPGGCEVVIEFEAGDPVRAELPDGTAVGPRDVIEALNRHGAAHGVGRLDVVEDRITGIKTRELYEAPAATILVRAHQAIEAITLPRRTIEFADEVTPRYGLLVYDGRWFSGLREALDAFFLEAQRPVSGEVRVRLNRGTVSVTGRRADHTLYDPALSAFGTPDRFHAAAAEGFGRIWTLEQRSEGAQRRAREAEQEQKRRDQG
ncbi:MAG: argininosuccinate synthase [Planctomycetota bacterium]|jgi:argininosuccinate synthase